MSTIKVGPCGGDGGELKDMEDKDNITSIDKIRVVYSGYILGITITYTVDGCYTKSVTWGAGGGGTVKEFTLQTGEYITSITGYYGKSDDGRWFGLRALKFRTNFKTQGPYGKEVGTQFDLPAINGTVLGFHGRAGTTGLHALGVHIKISDSYILEWANSLGLDPALGLEGSDLENFLADLTVYEEIDRAAGLLHPNSVSASGSSSSDSSCYSGDAINNSFIDSNSLL